MSEKQDISVGLVLIYHGKLYECVEDDMTAETFDCNTSCAFRGKKACEGLACFPCERRDGKSVHFEEVESCK